MKTLGSSSLSAVAQLSSGINEDESQTLPGLMAPCPLYLQYCPLRGELRSQESSKLVVTNHQELEMNCRRNVYTTEIGKH